MENASQGEADNLEISKDELVVLKEQLTQLANKSIITVEGIGLDSTKGKVNVYLSKESLEEKKAKVLQYVKKEQIHWIVTDGMQLKLKDQ